jgi:hypothetical protein
LRFFRHNEVVTRRFTCECELCAELLTNYIAASNEIVDYRDGRRARPEPNARQLAAAMIDRALGRKNEARKRLLIHKKRAHLVTGA